MTKERKTAELKKRAGTHNKKVTRVREGSMAVIDVDGCDMPPT